VPVEPGVQPRALCRRDRQAGTGDIGGRLSGVRAEVAGDVERRLRRAVAVPAGRCA
jgi:hypothetical protein